MSSRHALWLLSIRAFCVMAGFAYLAYSANDKETQKQTVYLYRLGPFIPSFFQNRFWNNYMESR
jgi:hypothetical protein